jgi:hypothetical protein
MTLDLFTAKLVLKEDYPVTTMVKVDSINHGFFLGDGSAQLVLKYNGELQGCRFVHCACRQLLILTGGPGCFETYFNGSLKPPDSKLESWGLTKGGLNFQVCWIRWSGRYMRFIKT